MLSVEKNMCIWPLAFTLGSDVLQGHAAMKGTSCCNECGAVEYCYFRGDKAKFSDKGIAVMSYKVMLPWREHPAAMSAVPLSTATSEMIKRSSVRQALLQRLPSAFPLKCCTHMLSVDKNMCIWPLAFTLGSDVLQGHAAMNGTSCCNECGAIEYCYFRGDKTKFSDTGIAATFAISVSIVKRCKHLLSVEKNMCIWPLAFTVGSDVLQGHAAMKEHPAAMSAVPLSTATSEVIKRSSVRQALPQRLPSAFPLWSGANICCL